MNNYENRLTKLEQVADTGHTATQQIERQKRQLQFCKNNLAWVERELEKCKDAPDEPLTDEDRKLLHLLYPPECWNYHRKRKAFLHTCQMAFRIQVASLTNSLEHAARAGVQTA